MARIRAKDTSPEIRLRKAAHALGFRFRLHRNGLPGKPDLVFPKLQIAMFVHGCFWHQHRECRRASSPKSRTDYWGPKLARNVERDARNASALESLGWRVVTIWECQTTNFDTLNDRLLSTLRTDQT